MGYIYITIYCTYQFFFVYRVLIPLFTICQSFNLLAFHLRCLFSLSLQYWYRHQKGHVVLIIEAIHYKANQYNLENKLSLMM